MHSLGGVPIMHSFCDLVFSLSGSLVAMMESDLFDRITLCSPSS